MTTLSLLTPAAPGTCCWPRPLEQGEKRQVSAGQIAVTLSRKSRGAGVMENPEGPRGQSQGGEARRGDGLRGELCWRQYRSAMDGMDSGGRGRSDLISV